ncbi:MAG: DUF1549 and DUF1553 domain-containing protein [Pirellulaceae bacterium]
MRHIVLLGWSAVILPLALAPAAHSATETVLPPADRRFQESASEEVPAFDRHVLPLLGRLGCNGRACHGSFQGQGGFRLSLFGYDFDADHLALTDESSGRVDLGDPAESLILQKPTLATDHGGGRLIEPGGWQYRLLRRWIESGAPPRAEDAAAFDRLEVEPRETVFRKLGEKVQLRVVAHWSDGAREDVTPLCRFRTNDESVAVVSDSGEITAVGKGDTHVIAFYDNGTLGAGVMLPVSDQHAENFPAVKAPTKIDQLVTAKLRKLGIVPAELCTDAEFLRRVSLDMTGTLPTPEAIESFLADASSDKRERKIEELLQHPGYAAWWTTRLCDFTGNSEENLPVGGEQSMRPAKSRQWYDWLHRRVAENRPYDEIVENLVVAVSRRPGQTDEEYFQEMTAYFRDENPADFTERETMPYFWSRGRFTPPQTLRFSYAFLGIRLECAECHKHPYDQWTKDDFDQFKAFFDGINFTNAARKSSQEMKEELGLTADQDSGQYKSLFLKLAKSGTIVPWMEVTAPSPARQQALRKRQAKVTGRVLTPKLLGGDEVLAEEYADPRQPLMDWLREKDNPYFARALVNRVWADYFGVGIVDPPDDMNLANPASNEPLLAYLAESFVASGYDLQQLHREITTSHTYQRSWRINETNAKDQRNYSHALVRRLPAEVAYDALVHATSVADQMQSMHHDAAMVQDRAIGFAGSQPRYGGKYALQLFGKPPREVNCDCERSAEPSLLQTVYLRNDAEVGALIDRRDGWLKTFEGAGKNRSSAVEIDDEDFLRACYLRTLCRPPTEQEAAAALEHLARAESPQAGRRDLLWALLNTKEFLLNH